MGDPITLAGNNTYTLAQLGITTSKNVFGEERWTIVLPPNPLFGAGEACAVFDKASSRWQLSITGNSRFEQEIDKKFKRQNSIDEKHRPTPRPVKWTNALPRTAHVDNFLNSTDWEATPMGPLHTWPQSLQAYLSLVLADSQAAVIYWGDDLVALYNEPFIKLVNGRLAKSGDLFGTPFKQIWPELWDDFEPMLSSIAAGGSGIEIIEINLFAQMNGVPEETFWQGSFLPIRDDEGKVRGFYNRAREITKTVINERRAKVLGAIAAKPNLTGDFIFKHIITSLSTSDRDFPLAFVYSAEDDAESGKCQLKFESGQGVPEAGHPLLPDTMELYDGSHGFTPFFRKAKSKDNILVLHDKDASLPKPLVSGFDWSGFGEASQSLAILPLSTSDRLLGILVVGLNPRRPYDEESEAFLNTLLRSISAIVASALDREEARNRAERLAKQLENSEKQIREIAEYGPVGIARLSSGGKLTWANDQYYEITGQRRNEEDQYELSLLELVREEDKEQFKDLWKVLSEGHKATSIACRIQKTWQPPLALDTNSGEASQPVWILVSGYPIMDNLEIKAYAFSVSDISRFKWAEQVQRQSAIDAKEAKRLQENFIDIVSHELRNPLSAIMQLTDGISTSLEEFEASGKLEDDVTRILQSNVDSANTILLCAAHQKRIVDDVLTLSKLDSMLLSITPVVVQPYKIVESVLRMFEAEFDASSISVDSRTTESYLQFGVDWVALDPSRLTQILINLITNAVKFTKLEAQRRIAIRVGATQTRPPSLAGVTWFPTHKKYKDLTLGPEWGAGEPIFICFEVQDTGRGLEQEEMNKLFERFQQATEKTHVKYGGSGLGLFISRELTESQGGECGVKSEPRKGTTFAFYIKARKVETPAVPIPVLQPQKPDTTAKNEARQASRQRDMRVDSESDTDSSLTILLVEDNVINARVLKKQLEKAHCDVHLANHGMEALDILQRTTSWQGMSEDRDAITFDVILLDIEMPVMDGLTCTRRIRQLESEGKLNKRTNIITISANARQEQIQQVLQAGADDILPKPFRVKECMQKIRQLLRDA